MSLLKRPGHIFYGWWLVGITIVTLGLVVSPIFQGLGTFFVVLEREFGWSRTVLSGAFALSRAEGALLGPVEGILTDRLGPRRMVQIGLLTLGLGFIGLSFIHGIIGFYVAFLIMFLGAGLGGFLPLMAAINHWFIRRRTTAMAIGMTGFNFGALLVPAMAWAVTSLGWRPTSLGMGVLMFALAFPISFAVRDRPEDYGLRPDGDPPLDQETTQEWTQQQEEEPSFTVREALGTSAFWAITAAHGFSAIAGITIAVHIIPDLTDIGMSLPLAGTVVTTIGIVGVVFQLVGGFAGDRLPKPPLIAAFIVIQALGMFVLATVQTVPGAFLFAVLYGIGFGGRIPLLVAIRGDYFGRENFATILGVSQLPMNLASMGAPIAAGYFFDTLGSYMVPFLSLAVMNVIGAILILLARKPIPQADRQRQEVPVPSQAGD